MDEGPQAPLGFQLHGRADLEANVRKMLTPLASLGAAGVSLDAFFDQDHAHHHAITDTFDKVDPRVLAIDTAVMGVAAWSLADAPTLVGRRLSEAAVMEKSGVASTRRMLYGSSRR